MNLMAMRTGLRVLAHPCGSAVESAILADDMKIRCDAAPAGMANAALLHSVIKIQKHVVAGSAWVRLRS